MKFEIERSQCPPSYSPYLLSMALQQLWPEAAHEFTCVFQYQGTQNSVSYSAIGKAAEIRVFCLDHFLLFQLEILGKIIFTEKIEYNANNEMLYPKLFDGLSLLYKKTKAVLPDYFKGIDSLQDKLCFLGGWKACVKMEGEETLTIFTLPRILVRKSSSLFMAGCLSDNVPRFSLADILDLAESASRNGDGSPKIISTKDEPDKQTHIKNIAWVLKEIGESEKLKAVIARRRTIELDTEKEPLEIAFSLSKNYAQVYSYFFQWDKGKAWFGVSPEILLQKRQAELYMMPLAGTRKLSDSSKKDIVIQELLSDVKENREHRLALELMRDDLKEICEPDRLTIRFGDDVMDLGYLVHIKSELKATLKRGNDTFTCLGRIYPVATIWGNPRKWSQKVIASCEAFKREFYTGGLGYLTLCDHSNFALAIRTGVIDGKSFSIFAGGGIVKGSVPEKEWEETVTKMLPVLSLWENKA